MQDCHLLNDRKAHCGNDHPRNEWIRYHAGILFVSSLERLGEDVEAKIGLWGRLCKEVEIHIGEAISHDHALEIDLCHLAPHVSLLVALVDLPG